MIMSEKFQILVSARLPIFFLSRRFWNYAETKISAGASRITRPAELNEILQYINSIESVFLQEGL